MGQYGSHIGAGTMHAVVYLYEGFHSFLATGTLPSGQCAVVAEHLGGLGVRVWRGDEEGCVG